MLCLLSLLAVTGSEKEEWSDSDAEDGKSEQKKSVESEEQPTFKLREDGYDSGDLGDVSMAYATETPPPTSSDKEPSSKVLHKTKKKVKKQEDVSSDEEVVEKREVLRTTCEVTNKQSGETSEVKISLPNQKLAEAILAGMWRYCHAYHISNTVSTLCIYSVRRRL